MYRQLLTVVALVLTPAMTFAQGQLAAGGIVQPLVGGLDTNNFRRVWMNILPIGSADPVNRVYLEKGNVFVATPKNVFYAIDRSVGVLKYYRYVDGGGEQSRRPVITQDYIVFPGRTNLELYTPAGDFVKSVPVKYTISSPVVANGDQFYMGIDAGGGELANVNITADFRPLRWQLIVNGEVRGSPAYYKDIIYIGSGDGSVKAITPERTAAWTLWHDGYQTDGAIQGDVTAEDSGIYASSQSGRVVCLEPNSGRLKWEYIAPEPLLTGPVVTATSIYQFVPGHGLAALNKSETISVDPDGRRKTQSLNRRPRWVCADAVQFVSEDALFTYVRTVSGELWAVDHETGQVRYRGAGAHFATIGENLTDNIIYAVTRDGVAFAIRPVLQPGSPGYLQ